MSTSLDDGSPTASPHGPPGGPAAAFANAYAITYRLLGDRRTATDLALDVAGPYESLEDRPPANWLPDLVADAVFASLRAAGSGASVSAAPPGSPPAQGATRPAAEDAEGGPAEVDLRDPVGAEALGEVDDAAVREALRRRLRAADARTRVAVGLHHLAGYDVAWVGALMSCPAETVHELCAPFAPPPGVSWDDLGDPEAIDARPKVVRRRRPGRLWGLPWWSILSTVVVLALVLWAARSVGPRPTLGTPVPDTARATFDPDAEPLASSGCEVPAGSGASGAPDDGSEGGDGAEQPPGPEGEDRELLLEGESVPWQLTAPTPTDLPGSDPAPLVVTIADDGQSAAEFRDTSDLEAGLPDAVHATLGSGSWSDPDEGLGSADTIGALVDFIVSESCVDLRRVSVVGYGAGAPLAAEAACELPEVVATVAMVSGWRSPEGCRPLPPWGVLITANSDDPSVSSRGVTEAGDEWAEVVGGGSAQVEATSDDTIIRRWTGDGDVPVQTVVRTTGGHDWSSRDTVSVVEFVSRAGRSLG